MIALIGNRVIHWLTNDLPGGRVGTALTGTRVLQVFSKTSNLLRHFTTNPLNKSRLALKLRFQILLFIVLARNTYTWPRMNEYGASLASAHVSSVPTLVCIRVKVWLQYLPSASHVLYVHPARTTLTIATSTIENSIQQTLFDYASKSVQKSLVQQVEGILLKKFLEAENNKYVKKRVKRRAATTLLTCSLRYRRTIFYIWILVGY